MRRRTQLIMQLAKKKATEPTATAIPGAAEWRVVRSPVKEKDWKITPPDTQHNIVHQIMPPSVAEGGWQIVSSEPVAQSHPESGKGIL